MRYSVCIETPNTFYNIGQLTKEEVELISSAFEEKLDDFFLSGRKHDIKDIKVFKVFSYENVEEYTAAINSDEIKGEAYIVANRAYFKPYSLAKVFPDVTNDFIRKFSVSRKNIDIIEYPYVNKTRLDELRNISSANFDLKRLLKLCDEINYTFSNKCFISTIILVRALLDHIPPIFGKRTFTEIANNHGGKSFKDSMDFLDKSSRKIADLYLHTHISNKESIPVEQQVNYSQPLDVLLTEIIKILK